MAAVTRGDTGGWGDLGRGGLGATEGNDLTAQPPPRPGGSQVRGRVAPRGAHTRRVDHVLQGHQRATTAPSKDGQVREHAAVM